MAKNLDAQIANRNRGDLKSQSARILEEDKRATTNMQNGLVFFFFILLKMP